ncbi:MAG: nodulation protein NfeD [Paracoccaceae bacterium]|nr:nodulation protein NfeD [Paracoccaceae bacterium]
MVIGHALGRLLLAAAALGLVTALWAPMASGQATDTAKTNRIALHAAIEGPIGPATTRHIERVIEAARERRPEVVILRIYTPGGLADAMRDVIAEILASPVPVVGYVAPPGAHAASAGTYILYATHVAAMAPGTNLGAATPVAIGMPGAPKDEPKGEPDPGAAEEGAKPDTSEAEKETAESKVLEKIRGLAPDEAMAAKATNDAVAFIRSLAEMHGRNADWAEKAVREAASLSSAQALEQGVIDLVADDAEALLEALDGRSVTINGAERRLATEGLAIETVEIDGITRLLSVLSNPNVALILMMLGFYGIIFEFWNPGSIVPGVVGAISLTLGLYALNQLPLDYAGLALIMLGVVFMVAEAFTPTFGILGFGGLAAFVLGSAMLIDTDAPGYQISWWVIGVMAAISASVLILLLGFTLRAYRRPARADIARVIGGLAQVQDWSGASGHVWAAGELWRARSAGGAPAPSTGEAVRVRGVDGLTLLVDHANAPESDLETDQ